MTKVALLTAARELRAQSWEVAILSSSGQGEAISEGLGGPARPA